MPRAYGRRSKAECPGSGAEARRHRLGTVPALTERPHRAHGAPPGAFPLGTRIHVIGSSGSGKSTLARRLAGALDAEFVELDALNWQPGWVGLNEVDPPALAQRFRDATAGERWVTAGSYSRLAQAAFWPHLHSIVWLDLPAGVSVFRMLRRSWQRWRRRELLWGTNVERFWPQLMVWRREDSLLWWLVVHHARKRRDNFAAMADSRWRHIRFVRLVASADVEALARAVAPAPLP